jgi:hypothetical protein
LKSKCQLTGVVEFSSPTGTGDGKLIPLTSNEIRRLFAKLVLAAAHTATHAWHWSHYRRRRQQQARASHYRKRLKPP